MPPAELLFYCEAEGGVPILDWLDGLPVKARLRCIGYLRRLAASGHELRRPVADYLRDGIYELRPSYQGIGYRILYFFDGRDVVVVSHGITKEQKVPDIEIRRALARKLNVSKDRTRHTVKPRLEER